MHKVFKILLRLNLFWVIFCSFVLTAGQYLPFEFSNERVSHLFYTFIWLTFPVAIIVFGRNQKVVSFRHWSVAIAIILFIVLSFSMFGRTFCAYSNVPIFENSLIPSIKIIERSYGCGAYDSDYPKYEYYKIIPILPVMNYITRVDTTEIDHKIYKPLKKE